MSRATSRRLSSGLAALSRRTSAISGGGSGQPARTARSRARSSARNQDRAAAGDRPSTRPKTSSTVIHHRKANRPTSRRWVSTQASREPGAVLGPDDDIVGTGDGGTDARGTAEHEQTSEDTTPTTATFATARLTR